MPLSDLPLHLTRHARGRMRWRHITVDEIRAVITDPDSIEHRNGKIRLSRRIDDRLLLVIIAVESDRIVLITAMDHSS